MDYIRLKAADQGFEVIEKDEFSLINERYKKSVEDLAEENGLVALKVEDYNNLIQNANEPALAHISEMATKHEHVVVSANDFNKYLNTFEHPELEFIKEKAKEQGYTVVLLDDYASIVAENKETLEEKAEKAHAKLIPVEEYTTQQETLNNPSIDFLNEKAKLLQKLLYHNWNMTN